MATRDPHNPPPLSAPPPIPVEREDTTGQIELQLLDATRDGGVATAASDESASLVDAVATKVADRLMKNGIGNGGFPPSGGPPRHDTHKGMKLVLAAFGAMIVIFGIVFAAGKLTASSVNRDMLDSRDKAILEHHDADIGKVDDRLRKIEKEDVKQTVILERIDDKIDKLEDK